MQGFFNIKVLLLLLYCGEFSPKKWGGETALFVRFFFFGDLNFLWSQNSDDP
jgi:hypothetical protein